MINVLSLFDGISCGQLALQRAGIKVDTYYASEIDKHAIKVTQKKFPNTVQLGDVQGVDFNQYKNKVDLLIGGSPCQDLSIAKKDRRGLKGSKSSLFWQYIKALETIQPQYFLLENVASMSKEDRDVITETLGIKPILINSSLLSSLERKRYYWTNIPGVEQPKDRGWFCDKIIQQENEINNKYYFTDGTNLTVEKVVTRAKQKGLGYQNMMILDPSKEKFKNLDANYHKGFDGKRSMFEINGKRRRATPVECERLQTLPDGYTEGISDTQRYRCLGNGWTVDVIAHIFSYIKENQ